MTNQASEDELRDAILTEFKQVYKLAGSGDYTENCTNVVMSIIRTEKLKLLAEVRERVVGEDERIDIQSEFDKIDVPHLETDKYPGLDGVRQASRNLYRNHQREALTKLEAEL